MLHTPPRIVEISFAVPPVVKMDEFADLFAQDPGGDDVTQVIQNSAIAAKGMAVNPFKEDPRHWSARERMDRSLVEARALGKEAIVRALERAGLRPDEIGLLATTTTTTHSAPGLDALMPELGMRPNAESLSLGPMGCYAALPALATCRNWVAVHNRPAVLLCVDLFSPHLQPPPYDKEKAVVLTLFGDGAAAVVLLPGDRRPAGRSTGFSIVDSEMLTDPRHADDLQVHVGDGGMRIRLAPVMPEVVATAVGKPTDALLTRHGLRTRDIRWWALHPGGRRIIDRVAAELDLPEFSVEASRGAMRDFGNTAAPAVLGVLERLQDAAPLGPTDHAMALAFGPGATLWAVLLRGAA